MQWKRESGSEKERVVPTFNIPVPEKVQVPPVFSIPPSGTMEMVDLGKEMESTSFTMVVEQPVERVEAPVVAEPLKQEEVQVLSDHLDDRLGELRALFRASKQEARFVGGLDKRQLGTFYLIDCQKAKDIFGGQP
jgi:hypothetical protein